MENSAEFRLKHFLENYYLSTRDLGQHNSHKFASHLQEIDEINREVSFSVVSFAMALLDSHIYICLKKKPFLSIYFVLSENNVKTNSKECKE